MSGRIAIVKRFISHWLETVDEHSLHSPFIYDFQTSVIGGKIDRQKLQPIHRLRNHLLKDNTIIRVTDFGAGNPRPRLRTIGNLAKTSNQLKVSRLLYAIAKRYSPLNIIELGTNLGLSALHLAVAAPEARIMTFEGCPEISKVAKSNFDIIENCKIELIIGSIEKNLSPLLSTLDKIDLVFIDANHQYQPTLDYFFQCLPKLGQKSVVVVDDIHWSEGMEKAWEEIMAQTQVTLSVDLFLSGVVFFDKNVSKSHYILSL